MPRFVTIPNAITVFRLILVGGAFFLFFSEWIVVAFSILFFSLMLDLVDGWVARRLDQETRFGKYFDSFVDKISLLVLFCFFVLLISLPLWTIVLFVLTQGIQMLFALDLFSYAEYPAACCRDEGKENPAKPRRSRVSGFGEFRRSLAALLRGASSRRNLSRPKTYLGFMQGGILFLLFFSEFQQYFLSAFAAASILHLQVYAHYWAQERKISVFFHVVSFWGRMMQKRESPKSLSWKEHLFSVANLLTMIRFLIVMPVAATAFLHNDLLWIPLVILFSLLDILDGQVARVRGEASRMGQFLDAVADKTFVGVAAFLAWQKSFLTPELFGLILLRIVLIAGIALSLSRFHKTLPVAVWSFPAIVITILTFFFPQPAFQWMAMILWWLTIVDYAYQALMGRSYREFVKMEKMT